MFGQIILYLLTFSLAAQCKLTDQKLSSILGELVDLRTELGDLFQSPRKRFENEEPESEWVVHIDRGVAEAQWIANLTNTKFVGPVSIHNFFSDIQNDQKPMGFFVLDARLSRSIYVPVKF